MTRLLAKIFRVFLFISCKFITGVQGRWLIAATNRVIIDYTDHTRYFDGVLCSYFSARLPYTAVGTSVKPQHEDETKNAFFMPAKHAFEELTHDF